MADPENKGPCVLRNAQIDAGAQLYEIRVVLEALSHGLKTLLKKREAEPVKGELVILENFAAHAIDAMGSLDEAMALLLSWSSPEGSQV